MEIDELKEGYYVIANDQFARIIYADVHLIKAIDTSGKLLITHIDHIHPIPLSLDLLQRHCGFNENGILSFTINNTKFYLKLNSDHIVLYSEQGIALVHFWEVAHLHRLQRIYFGLTGHPLHITFEKKAVS